MMTLEQALYLIHSRTGSLHLHASLDGLPVGGWGETQQAIDRLDDALPRDRDFSLADLIHALYDIRGSECGHYVRRQGHE